MAQNIGSTSNKSAAELKKWYEENHVNIERFKEANSAWTQFRDVTKTQTKTVTAFDKDTLRGYLENIGSNESNLRNLSWYLYYRSQVYARICNFYANMFCLDARSVVPQYDLIKTNNDSKILKSYQNTLDFLESMRLQQEFYNIYLTCFVQDVFYGIVIYDESGVFIYPWNADYAKISGKYTTGDYSFAIDCSYLSRYKELLEYMPDPLQSLYNEYQSTRQKWQEVPEEYAICLKFRSEEYQLVLPPLEPIFEPIINLIDLEDIQAVVNEQSIYKLIWMELETISGSKNVDDFKVDVTLANKYFQRMMNDALPDYISAALVPGKLNEISFPDDQATDTNKIASATETVLNTAGGAEILNGATISNTYAFKMACIQNTEYAISSLLPQTQSFVNRFAQYHVSNPSKIKFFPISVYTKADYRDNLLKAGQNGLPTILALNTLNDFTEKETLSLNYLEQTILGLGDKLRPLSTSYTQSSDDYTNEVGQGAPTKDVVTDDVSDSGERGQANSGT